MRSQKSAELRLETALKQFDYCDADRQLFYQEYDYQVEFVLPLILRSPFIVSLYSVYESTLIEISRRTLKTLGRGKFLNSKGDFVDQAKKHYEEKIPFELSTNEDNRLLYDLRNSIAHTNGRVDKLGKERKARILAVEGIENRFGFLLISQEFLAEIFKSVRADLEDLVARYKEWDTEYRASQQNDKEERQ